MPGLGPQPDIDLDAIFPEPVARRREEGEEGEGEEGEGEEGQGVEAEGQEAEGQEAAAEGDEVKTDQT